MKKINKTNFVKHANTFKLIKTLLKLLSKKNKLNLSFLIIIILLNGLTEVVSISATIPVISIILNQENFLNSKWGLFISNTFKNQNLSQLTLITTIVFIFLIFLSTLIRTINIYFTTKLNANIGYDFGKEMIENTLRRPYEEQINTKSSDLINRQTYFVEQTNRALIDFIQAFGNSIISLFILSYLFYLNAATCISALILFSSIYYIFSILSKRKLSQNSLRNIKLKEHQVKYIQECFGSIKEIILDNSYSYHIQNHSNMDREIWKIRHQNAFIRQTPRYIIESAGIIFIVITGVVIKNAGIYSNTEVVIQNLAAFALASQKLLPALQKIYTCWTSFKSRKDAIIRTTDYILDKRRRFIIESKNLPYTNDNSLSEKINFKGLQIVNASYAFDNNKKNVLNNINLTINSGDKIGIIGKTGSGKSTTIDIIIGLLKPQEGFIYLNGKELHKDENLLKIWRSSIAHVPQSIFLKDTNILDNIIYNNPKKNYDLGRLSEAIRKSQLYECIQTMPKKLETRVGERGSMLSGGQKQRIGIARALYKKCPLIVLDESTNALDKKTEKKIIQSLFSDKNSTLIIISHDLSNLKECDYLIKIEKGTLNKVPNYL